MNMLTPVSAGSSVEPLIVDFNTPHAGKRFAESLNKTGFAILRLKNGQKGIYQHELLAARQENIAYLELPFEEKFKSIFLNDAFKDAGWFPFGAEGRTDGPPNLVEYLHHRANRRGLDFAGHPFKATWAVYRGMCRLQAILTAWAVENMPAKHPAQANMHRLSTQVDTEKRSVIRFLKYMAHDPRDAGVLPAWDESGTVRLWNDPHEDADWWTLIPAPSKPGLQPRGLNGEWYNLPWEENSGDDIMIIVNAGDTLSAASGGKFALCKSEKRPDGTTDKLADPLTFDGWADAAEALHMWRDGFYYTDRRLRLVEQGYYPSTTHRVVAGDGVRYSMPFFFHINGWVKIQGEWTAYDKMRGYVRNKEAQRAQALKAIQRANDISSTLAAE